MIVAPGLDRYNATAAALNSAGQCFIPTETPFSWTIKIQVSPASKIRGQGPDYVEGDGPLLTPRATRTASTAWLASGLFRRVGLRRIAGVPLSTTS
ncbi:hypothetical protein GCM10010371_66490 [Streptomyces subrutilus]|uniref:Uncharacterized protein n=1 Tax=Streptomyces subrutilus TaxID=36818 RepID=A0A918RFU3_9ACTN|nr:hypothetical protein GCM10010371_66490 [Streptomyces subrutilus]